jgi:DNA adenine methylase
MAAVTSEKTTTGHHHVDYDALVELAERTLSAVPRPFLRWAGSKQRLLCQLVPLLPSSYKRYFEPFLGAGSLFFLLRPKSAVLSDTCAELIATYKAVARDVEGVLSGLAAFDPLDKKQYYRVRGARSDDKVQRAAEFIYLNRAGWNGLYRVNSQGAFNVPYGAPKSSAIVDGDHLRECAKLLRRKRVSLQPADFDLSLAKCQSGDFAFLDPPYVTGHNNNGFIDYNERLFSWADQVRLARTAVALANRGVHVMVTNANHQGVVDLYKGFEAIEITRWSTLAGDKSARGMVTETVLRSFG